MKIYLIDCDSISRTELTGMIEAEELGEVSGVSAGWDDACRRIPGIRPDVILADLPLPALKVITCIRRIKEKLPESSIIMLSPAHDTETVQRAYEGGSTAAPSQTCEHDGDQERPAQHGNGSKHAVDPETGQERDHGYTGPGSKPKPGRGDG